MSSRTRARARSNPGPRPPAATETPLNLVTATQFISGYTADIHRCVMIWGPDGGYVSDTDCFYFPGPKTEKYLYEKHPNWNFEELRRILIENHVIRKISREETEKTIAPRIEKRINTWVAEHVDPGHMYQQLNSQPALKKYMMKKLHEHLYNCSPTSTA